MAGPAGVLECAVDVPEGTARGIAVVCHPHPLHGGTMDNKVVQTLARAFVQLGYRAVRFNFRGVGASAGAWDEGRGEIDDAMAVIAASSRVSIRFWMAANSASVMSINPAKRGSERLRGWKSAGTPSERTGR